MQDGQFRLGLCPIGKFVFSNEDAVRCKLAIQAKLGEWGHQVVDLEGILEDGLVKDQGHVDAAVSHFRAADIDALFMPHCNFGTEGAVGMIARKLGVPVLLWGPRDEAPMADGTRLRDTLCGLFASSNVLKKLGMPFSYIENCRIDDAPLRSGVETFVTAARAARLFRKGMKIGHIGQRIDFFWTTIINERELLERFNIEVFPMEMTSFIEDTRQRVRAGRAGYEKELCGLRETTDIEGFDDDGPMLNVLAMRDQMLALAETHGLDALAMQEFPSLVDAMGTYCCHAESMVGDRLCIAQESDIHGAVSCLIAQAAMAGKEPAFLAEFVVRHPQRDNAACVWHCGAPLGMLAEGERARVGTHWILPSPLSGMTHFRLRDGEVGFVRFDGAGDDYRLAFGDARTCAGPYTQNNYAWVEVDDWPHWERTLIEGPYIHHLAMVHGRVGNGLAEACRYIPGLVPESLNQAKVM